MISKSFKLIEVEELLAKSRTSIRRRQHLNLHASYEEPCQRLLNAIQKNSYIRPHRHALDPKQESLFALSGLLALICFDDSGEVLSIQKFGSEKYVVQNDVLLGVELPPSVWHTVIALVDDSILLEIKAGPFRVDAAKEHASWAPDENLTQALSYLQHLQDMVKS